MNRSKESDLTINVLLYAMRCVAEGDFAALGRMQFGAEEVEALKQLSVADLYLADRLSAHCMKIVLDPQVYWPLVRHLEHSRETEAVIQALLGADAPKEVFATYFGMCSRDYVMRRKAAGLQPGVGRPANLTEEESQQLWDVMQALGITPELDSVAPQQLLRLHQETKLPVRSIWRELHLWAQFDEDA